MPAEPGTSALIDLLRQRDIHVLLPRVSGEALDWIPVNGSTEFSESSLGILEPVGSPHAEALRECDAIVMPALAISRTGIRVGQGGGFYDRALQGVPSHADGGPLRIALIFDDELLDDVPHEPHDSRVDAVVTPERMLSF